MKASELRIGNYVNDTDGICCVDSIHSDDSLTLIHIKTANWFNEKTEHIKPIPLTQQWLLAAGFEPKNEYLVKGTFQINQLHYLGSIKFYTSIGWTKCELPYVHTLQNAYALTGQELEFDLPKIETHE